MAKERFVWLDSAKGIGIILIVLGHTAFPFNQYIYWFHVPLFFILSGITLNLNYPKKVFLTKKINSLIKPYLIYGGLLIVLNSLFFNEWKTFIKNFIFLFYGGQLPNGVLGAFWFVPTLFFAEIFLYFIFKKLSMLKTTLFYTLFYFCFFIAERTVLNKIPLPYNLDVVPLATLFLLFGIFLKEYISEFNIKTLFLNILILAFEILINTLLNIDFIFNLKYYNASHLVEDLLIPLTISLLIIQIFVLLIKKDKSLLASVGMCSLSIMFTHNFFIKFATTFLFENWLAVFIFSMCCSYVVAIILKKIKKVKRT